MPHYVYILRSESNGRYYCGQTNDMEKRLKQHNDPKHRVTKTTKRYPGPWTLIWTGTFETRALAMAEEKRIKKRGIGRFLDDMACST